MTPVDFMLCLALFVGSACVLKGWWTFCGTIQKMAGLLEPVTAEKEGRWWQGPVRCAICGETHRAVIQIGENETEPSVRMECHKCGSMACDPIDEDDE